MIGIAAAPAAMIRPLKSDGRGDAALPSSLVYWVTWL
jgi:hypothetical protein